MDIKRGLAALGIVAFITSGCGQAAPEESPVRDPDRPGAKERVKRGGASDASNPEQEPALGKAISGAGVGGAPLDGRLHVFVVDQRDRPLQNVSVRVGELQLDTDDNGRAEFEDRSLKGPQTVTAQAPGYSAASLVGVRADQATLALAPYPRQIATASVSGSIELPAPELGRYTVALVLYSRTAQFSAPENAIDQPMNGDAAANLCVRTTSLESSTCNWRMNVRTGRQVHYAIIVAGDPKDTLLDTADDSYELLGYAVQTDIDVSAGQTLTGERLPMLGAGDLTEFSVSMPEAPAGLDTRIALPFIDLGAQGQLVFPLPTLRPGSGKARVPALRGPFAGGRYLVVGLATPTLGAAHPFSSSFMRNVTAGSITLPAWRPAPGTPSGRGGTYAFTPSAGASFHLASFVDANAGDSLLWSVLLLDEAHEFELPELETNPWPASGLNLVVSAVDLPGFDKTDFSFQHFDDEVAQVSESSAALPR